MADLLINKSENLKEILPNNVENVEAETSLEEDFQLLADSIKTLIDKGSAALAEAESKTLESKKIDVNSAEFQKIIEEIEVAKNNAKTLFLEAENLINSTNELLSKIE